MLLDGENDGYGFGEIIGEGSLKFTKIYSDLEFATQTEHTLV